MRKLILAAIVTLSGLSVAVPAALAAGSIIHVTTTADGEFPGDGKCSLAAAIMASNTGASAGYCESGSTDADQIIFALGSATPLITLATELPAITAPVTISGPGNRVEISGSNTLTTGLDIQATATIRNLIIDGFVTGILISGTDGTSLYANIIGPNSDTGVQVDSGNSHLQVGSNVDNTPGDACNDDCNLISGNSRVGIEAYGGGTIEGNFIGTGKAGKQANPNGIGLIVGGGTWTIGGHSVPSRNLISGNTGDGLQLTDCTCTVQGNYIGTSIVGINALGNGGDGIDVESPYTTMIGGPVFGTPNVIAANGGNGVNVDTTARHDGAVLSILGNKIGVGSSEQALPNAGDGVYLGAFAPRTIVGDPGPHSGNKIARNLGAGVRVTGADDTGIEIRGNSIANNDGKGIVLESGANASIAPPVITGSSPLKGTACAHCTVDVYSDKADEGKAYQGSTAADGSGNWTYTEIVYGPNATATNTDANHNTSEFSAPFVISSGGGGGGGGADQPDGRINKFGGAYLGNNIYNTDGTHQSKSGTARVGYIVEFHLSLQNDGDEVDKYQLSIDAGSTAMYRIKFYRGSSDITAQVLAGTYQTPAIGPGSKLIITVDVIVKKGATVGSSVRRLVTITSVNDNAQVDALGFVAGRK
ncbi:MAG: hypothetical protein ABI725_07220 [Chloroflexota bacterium]